MREEASGSSGKGKNEEQEFTDLIEWRKGRAGTVMSYCLKLNLDNRRTGVNWSIGRNPAAGAGVGEYFAPYPDQVLENVPENVLDFLTSQRDRNAVALVCKSWYRAEAYTRSDVFIGNCYAVAPRRVTGRFSQVRSVTPTRLGCALLAVGLHHGHRLSCAGEDPP
ncbi:hypothetical protein L2E82_18906 [Cichorium intybus]|uniref:Uncharacterized protein n=1 Tax=Cichorium intybus TaxID=13427 RepID=A0ACB9FAD4_CICIN|nr:hypothetical protein L2E82_18906 [Cichorium intybus]